uniref:Uncharacterized protein n=1 Tax=Carcinus maenas virus 1 TaxID=2704945 RepID=A0A6G9HDG3_9VIRU|nr:hypothetical protein [Carcinus maenas virus 1]
MITCYTIRIGSDSDDEKMKDDFMKGCDTFFHLCHSLKPDTRVYVKGRCGGGGGMTYALIKECIIYLATEAFALSRRRRGGGGDDGVRQKSADEQLQNVLDTNGNYDNFLKRFREGVKTLTNVSSSYKRRGYPGRDVLFMAKYVLDNLANVFVIIK